MPKPKGCYHLTHKQEKFARCKAIDGMSDIDAYMTAYDSHSRNTAKTNAHRLKQNPEVVARIAELQDRVSFKMSWSKARSEKHLTEIVEMSMADGNPKALSNAVKAIQELNKMCGYHAPVKSAHMNIEVGAGDIDAIMRNLGFQRIGMLNEQNE